MAGIVPLPVLEPEILLLICEQLYLIEPERLSQARLVSWQLNEIALPFVYPLQRWQDNQNSLGRVFPPVLWTMLSESPQVGLSITEFSYWSDHPETVSKTQSVPSANLVSFKVNASGQSGSVDALQDLLVASRRLQTLIFTFIFPFLPANGRLPPIKHLILPEGTNWKYTPEAAQEIWDFSRLEVLQLPWRDLSPFLESVSPEQLGQLRYLRVDDSCWERSFLITPNEKYLQDKACTELQQALLETKDGFEELDIRCLLDMFDMSLIAKQGQFLRKLTILDVTGFEGAGTFPTVSRDDLDMIRCYCTRINQLDIGVNMFEDEIIRDGTGYGLPRNYCRISKSERSDDT
ncbi:hypothetical protein DL98DRAFT_524225 [Cadophora sp. DSE1049]|nr:hypothetical protein DL98DRAFT_524225 [Cadophora sp. DSE1049]